MMTQNTESNVTSNSTNNAPGAMLGKVAVGVALAAALGGLWFQSSQVENVRKELAQTHQNMERMRGDMETSVTAVKEQAKISVEESNAKLAAELAAARKEAKTQVARVQAAAKQQTGKAVQELAEKNHALESQLTELKTASETKASQVDETLNGIKGDVGGVRTEVAATRTELDKTISDLRRMTGDMGVMSGLIATNSTELDALKKLGERDYFEFTIVKSAPVQKVGGVQLALKKADTKRNRFTVDVVADDRRVEKKDKGLNEPVQFYTSQARQPFELVVNEIAKDKITGYISVPKVKQMARR
jgi:DNA anti-recombination protein RmuC